jgi:hypothetical protein
MHIIIASDVFFFDVKDVKARIPWITVEQANIASRGALERYPSRANYMYWSLDSEIGTGE